MATSRLEVGTDYNGQKKFYKFNDTYLVLVQHSCVLVVLVSFSYGLSIRGNL